MGVLIDEERARNRHDAYLMDHYVNFYLTLVNVSLAIGGLAVAKQVSLSDRYSSHLPILCLLLTASWVAAMVSYSGTVAGAAVLPAGLPTFRDLLAPFGIGAAQFTMFALLSGQAGTLNNSDSEAVAARTVHTITTWWFIAFALWATFVVLAMQRARALIFRALRERRYSLKVAGLAARHARHQIEDSAAAAGGGLFALAGVAALRWHCGIVVYVCGAVIIVLLSVGLGRHSWRTSQERMAWRRALEVPSRDTVSLGVVNSIGGAQSPLRKHRLRWRTRRPSP